MARRKFPEGKVLKRKGELYCVKDEQFFQMLNEVMLQSGGSWRSFAAEVRLSTRYVRRLRNTEWVTVSYSVMEKVLLRTGFPHRIRELEWYTPDQLVEMEVWKPHNATGLVNYEKWSGNDRERVLREKKSPSGKRG